MIKSEEQAWYYYMLQMGYEWVALREISLTDLIWDCSWTSSFSHKVKKKKKKDML